MTIRSAARLYLPVALAVVAFVAAPAVSTQQPGTAAPAPATGGTVAKQAPPLSSDPIALLSWRGIGPPRGGRSIAATGVKGRPREAYFGAVGGGLWKTVDAGENWTPVTDGQLGSSSVGAVAVSESNPDVLFIGMGESCIRGNIMPGDGVYKSTDAGKTWTHVGFSGSDAISRIRIHPARPDVVFVASFGKYGVESDERGVFKSVDGGKNWRKTLFRDARTGAVDIAIDRRNPDVIYAALWEAFRVEYQMSSGGPGSGLFKSTDGGETWTEITRHPGLPSGVVGRIGVDVSGADSNRVYALVENAAGGLFVSDDAGATWKVINEDRRVRQRAFYYTHVTADPNSKDTVYLLNTAAFRSTDGGKTLTPVGGGTHGDHHDLWIDPDDSKHLVLGNDGGGAVSATAAKNWSAQDFPTGQFYHVATTKHVPYHVCGAQQDGATVCLPSDAGLAGGRGNQAVAPYGAGGSEPGYIAPDPKDPDVFFAGGNNGTFMTRLNRRTGELREVNPYPRMFSGEPASALVERWQWTYPIVFSPVDPNVLYTSSQHVWRTMTGGQSWEKISGDLTRHDPKTMGESGGPITKDMNSPEVYGTVFALGPGKTNVNILWAGSDDGLVHVTRDGGKSWVNVTPKDMPEFGRVSQIDASSFEPGGAYIAVKKPLLNDFAPYIFRTRDYGRTWTRIVNGIGAEPACDPDLGPRRRGELAGDRDARPELLHPRRPQRREAGAGDCDVERGSRSFQAGRRDSRWSACDAHLSLEVPREKPVAGDSRRRGARRSDHSRPHGWPGPRPWPRRSRGRAGGNGARSARGSGRAAGGPGARRTGGSRRRRRGAARRRRTWWTTVGVDGRRPQSRHVEPVVPGTDDVPRNGPMGRDDGRPGGAAGQL
jgi:photosystem II stability/assembly factor-like uncharacterized protein